MIRKLAIALFVIGHAAALPVCAWRGFRRGFLRVRAYHLDRHGLRR